MAQDDPRSSLRHLPSVDALLRHPALGPVLAEYRHEAVVEVAREVLAGARARVLAGEPAPSQDELADEVLARAAALWRPSLVPVVNASGVIIHTNLGRAPLSAEALSAMQAVAASYSNLEYELIEGERGSRHAHVSDVLARVTGAEAGMVVNNNAAAVFLALSALARGGEVVVSRGQAVEIGGGFRIPDVLGQSGARLVEVGTTNRTYVADYERAIGPDTALLLRVHSSNFRVVGFTHEAEIEELGALGRTHGVPLLDDIGSGALLDTAAFGLAPEPMPQRSLAAGAALVCFSGDKLLGGPQAGLIVGRREYVERLRGHPLARAVRVDKMTLAALQVTLLHYARGEAVQRVPVWRMIAVSVEDLSVRAERWAEATREWGVGCDVVDALSAIGGGSLPGETLPTRALSLSEAGLAPLGLTADVASARLRAGRPPVVARIEQGRLLFDPRTVLPGQEGAFLTALRVALGT
ncbi:MAG: L-seryl-tRNA(Sec) selenium transferase [Chloroflexota bacterium]